MGMAIISEIKVLFILGTKLIFFGRVLKESISIMSDSIYSPIQNRQYVWRAERDMIPIIIEARNDMVDKAKALLNH